MNCSPTLPKKAQVVEVKQGDTLMLGCQALDADEEPVPLTDVVVTSQMRDEAGELIVNMEYESVNATIGTYELWYPGTGLTDDVEPGLYKIDIQYSAPYGMRELKRSSNTFYVRVLAGVTEP